MGSLDERLRAVPFFRALPAADLEAIGGRLTLRAVRKGAVLFREGDHADAMYLVDSGQLEVLHGRTQQAVAMLAAGSFVGELGLLLGEPRSATLRAASACRLWSLARDDLEELLASHPAIGVELSAELGRRLVSTTRRLAQEDVTRITCAFGDSAAPLAAALAAEGLQAGVLGLRSVAVPDGVTGLDAAGIDAEALAAMSGRRFRELDHVVVAAPRTRNAVAAAAVSLSEWLVTSDDLPGWARKAHSPSRVLTLDRAAVDPATVARRVSGRAVAVALSSGGSKTVAHIGVVTALRERGVRIDALSGSSGGALVAVIAGAANTPMSEMAAKIRELAALLSPRRWDFHLVPRSGLLKGKRVRDLFDRWTEGRDFSDLSVPVYVVASDMLSGEEIVITSGSVADALRASLSIPGAFDPWRYDGRVFIDGGVTDPLPAGPLRAAGYERVIASNVAGKDVDPDATPGERLPNIMKVMLRTVNLMEAEVIKAQLALADVVIRPHVTAKGSFDFSKIDEFIAEGRAAVERQAEDVTRLTVSRG